MVEWRTKLKITEPDGTVLHFRLEEDRNDNAAIDAAVARYARHREQYPVSRRKKMFDVNELEMEMGPWPPEKVHG